MYILPSLPSHSASEAKKKAAKTIKENRMKTNALYTPDISDSGRLFIRNLSYECKDGDIRELFSEYVTPWGITCALIGYRYGELNEVTLPVDKVTGKGTGIGFVQFVLPTDALQAASALDATTFQGRLLHILPAKPARVKKGENDTNDGIYNPVIVRRSSSHMV